MQLRLWRTPAQDGADCQSLAAQHIPALTGYRSVRLDAALRDRFDGRGSFSAPDPQGTLQAHTVLWTARGGWDYLVDFAAPRQDAAAHDAFIENVIGGIYFV